MLEAKLKLLIADLKNEARREAYEAVLTKLKNII